MLRISAGHVGQQYDCTAQSIYCSHCRPPCIFHDISDIDGNDGYD